MPLLQPETMTLGDTTFTVGCLPATVGWDLSAKVANILGDYQCRPAWLAQVAKWTLC